MRGRAYTTVWFYLAVAAGLLVAHAIRGPLFPWVLALAMIVSYTAGWPVLVLTALAVLSELFSQLPPGCLALALFTPWLGLHVPGRPAPDVSVLFFLWLLAMAAGQTAALSAGAWLRVALSAGTFHWSGIWAAVPGTAPSVAVSVAVAAFIGIIGWHELVAPYRVKRTIPLFKHV